MLRPSSREDRRSNPVIRLLRRGFGEREGIGVVGFCVIIGLACLRFYARHKRHQDAQRQNQVATAPAQPVARIASGALSTPLLRVR